MYKNFAGNSCSAPYTNMEKVYWLIVCVGGVHLYILVGKSKVYVHRLDDFFLFITYCNTA